MKRLASSLLVLVSGCAANQAWRNATPAERKVMFESIWNSRIGESVSPRVRSTVVVEKAESDKNGETEYVIRQLRTCRISLQVDAERLVLLSWAYVGDATRCTEDYYSPGA